MLVGWVLIVCTQLRPTVNMENTDDLTRTQQCRQNLVQTGAHQSAGSCLIVLSSNKQEAGVSSGTPAASVLSNAAAAMQEWLWCETWCGNASKHHAKTIDLCNNPLTKEPKLQGARRIVSEWPALDEEARSFTSQVQACTACMLRPCRVVCKQPCLPCLTACLLCCTKSDVTAGYVKELEDASIHTSLPTMFAAAAMLFGTLCLWCCFSYMI